MSNFLDTVQLNAAKNQGKIFLYSSHCEKIYSIAAKWKEKND